MSPKSTDWQTLVGQSCSHHPDVFLLNEMPFGHWISAGAEPTRDLLLESQRLHDEGLADLGELGSSVVLGSRPVLEGDRSTNQGFVWTAGSGTKPVHTKQFFPNEEGYFESRWFERGDQRFGLGKANGLTVGFLICTDVWFNEWARCYGRQGADLIVVPRATPLPSLSRWQTAICMAAIVSGCYVASSNRVGVDDRRQEFGGAGWIVDPFGAVLATTSGDEPVVAVEIDLALVERAKREYPCYVKDLPGGLE
jgi:N-carbamoylputrescine amidase